MAVASNILAPLLISGIVWLLVTFMLIFPMMAGGNSGSQAITLALMLLLTLVNIIMFLV